MLKKKNFSLFIIISSLNIFSLPSLAQSCDTELLSAIDGTFTATCKVTNNTGKNINDVHITVLGTGGNITDPFLFDPPGTIKSGQENPIPPEENPNNLPTDIVIDLNENLNNGGMVTFEFIVKSNQIKLDTTIFTKDGEPIEPPRKKSDPLSHWSGDQSNDAQISFDNESQTLSFGNMTVTPTLKLNDGSDSIADPLEGATITIGTSTLLDVDIEQGWFLSNSTIEYLVGEVPVLTADLVNGFLFREGGEPQFDSEFQYDLTNISVNNFIDSPYLDGLQTYTENGNSSFLSFNSNILDLSNNLTISAISTGEVSVDGKKIPEPTSVLSLLAIGTLGAASTLKRKLKSSKSAEKDLEKVS
ncbi:PEP-CTERM sorting domain-containing protein [Okeania sp. SIO2B3]|uniref:PEP-CTERM sorting domain-containing protein n=1 Tax=Okeania sp. SIO2B3 TaxID=2607784 RepID=UPI0025DC6844|nr:PEP-CTERM sorting domain-containing protein [Okeania sp. SIO2B3]